MQYRSLDSGLEVAELGMDGTALERELQKRDPLLSLQGWPSLQYGCIVWRVVRDTPNGSPETVLVWQSVSGEPYPLSSGLLDEIDRLDRNSRGVYANEDELDARTREQHARQQELDDEALRDDWIPKHGRPLLPRTPGLVASRRRARRDGKPHFG